VIVHAAAWIGMVQLSSQYVPFEHRGRVMSVLTLSYVVGDFVSRDILGVVRSLGMVRSLLPLPPALRLPDA
jgi:hypothetical protein